MLKIETNNPTKKVKIRLKIVFSDSTASQLLLSKNNK